MTKVYLIRHAEAEGNLYRRSHGWYDSLITELGYKQIDALEKRFEGVHFDAVYSSDLFRTKTTATAITRSRGLEVQTTPKLREIGLGVWEDQPWGDIERDDKPQRVKFNADPAEWNIEGREKYEDVQKRMREVIVEKAAEHDGGTIAMFSHGAAIRALIASIMGYESKDITKVQYCDNTGVTLFDVDNGEITIEFQGDASHLTKELTNFNRRMWWKKLNNLDDSNISFRKIDFSKDSEFYKECRRDTWKLVYGTEIPEDLEKEYLESAKRHNGEHERAIAVATQIGTVAGIVELNISKDADKNIGWIEFYYMTKKCRGQYLAVQLLGHAVSVFRAAGRKTIRIAVPVENENAIGFFKHFGFETVDGAAGVNGEADDTSKKSVVMEKDIAI